MFIIIDLNYSMKPVVFIVFAVLTCATAIPLGEFYPFGFAVSDLRNNVTDDGSSSTISLNTPFPFFDEEYSTLFVSTTNTLY